MPCLSCLVFICASIWDYQLIGNGGTIWSTEKLLGISAEMSLIVLIDFMPFYVFLMLFPVTFEVMILVVSFALPQNCRQQLASYIHCVKAID